MYNHYIKPYEKMPIAGIVWYQGEGNSNIYHTRQYEWQLKALIEAKMFDTQEEIIEPDFESILDIKSIIYATFSEQLRKKPSDLYIKSDHEKMASSTPVTKTMNYLKMNFQRDVSIEDCAKQIGYSESYVSHSLKKNLHITFLQARNNIRISYAKYLLRFKKMSIYMVGFECGFNSELTFKRVFKKLTNMTPQQFRKNTAENIASSNQY